MLTPRRLTPLLATTAALALAPPAHAAVARAYCVAGPSSPACPTAGLDGTFSTFAGLRTALAADEQNNVDRATVQVEPGTYAESFITPGVPEVLIAGDPAQAQRPILTSGGSDTTLNGSSSQTLTLRHLQVDATGTARAIQAFGPFVLEDVRASSADNVVYGQGYDATIRGCVLTTRPGRPVPAVSLQSGSATAMSITDTTIAAADRPNGVVVSGQSVSLDGVTVSALAPGTSTDSPAAAVIASVFGGKVAVTRSRLEGTTNGLVSVGASTTVSDSLLTARGPASPDGTSAAIGAGVQALLALGETSVRNVTAVASDPAGAGIVASPGKASAGLPPGKLTVTNVIARGPGGDLKALPPTSTTPEQGSLAVDHANYRPAAGDGVTAGAANQSGDPLWVDPTVGSGEDFHVRPGSPTLDAGGPVPAGTKDLDGAVRAQASPDLGAYEVAQGTAAPSLDPPVGLPPVGDPPPAPDTTAPTLSGVSLTNPVFRVGGKPTAVSAAAGKRRVPAGTIVRSTLSEPATLTLAIKRVTKVKAKKGKRARVRRTTVATLKRANGRRGTNLIAFSGRIGRKALKAGAYELAITATDAAGNRSAVRTVSFRTVR